jgi:hypothetical protein
MQPAASQRPSLLCARRCAETGNGNSVEAPVSRFQPTQAWPFAVGHQQRLSAGADSQEQQSIDGKVNRNEPHDRPIREVMDSYGSIGMGDRDGWILRAECQTHSGTCPGSDCVHSRRRSATSQPNRRTSYEKRF